MPGNVAATPATTDTYPLTRFTAYSCVAAYDSLVSEYCDGRTQQTAKVAGQRRLFRLAHRVTAAQAGTLHTFWAAHRNSSFRFRPQGATADIYVVFASAPVLTYQLGRFPAAVELLEVA